MIIRILRALTLFLSVLYCTKGFAQDAGADAYNAEAAAVGEAVFKANCKQCHAIDKQLVGPALKDAHKRWPSRDKLANFIKYPQKVIDGGDAYAKGLYDKYKQYMPNHDFLSDADINGTIDYIIRESVNPTVVAAASGGAAATTASTGTAAESGSATDLTPILILLIVILLLMVLVLVVVINVLNKFIRHNVELDEVDKEVLDGKINWGGFFGHPLTKGVITFVFIVIIGKIAFDKVYAVGIQQGYAPDQPVKFSHKLHAGMYEIDCNYCHTGVNKGKSATIPAVNICMNCHNVIKTNSPEIKKLWRAVEKNEPIKWVRVHNLPDLAYFNHAQHVNVGKVECETCHGAVKEMEVVQQHSTLTMGWCINCHRETVVKAEGNAYYDKLSAFHKEYGSSKEMKVEDIGGLECSKCHY
jgi:cytochrome c551/c552